MCAKVIKPPPLILYIVVRAVMRDVREGWIPIEVPLRYYVKLRSGSGGMADVVECGSKLMVEKHGVKLPGKSI